MFFSKISIRHFKHEITRVIVTVLGVALGVALVLDIHLTNWSALDSFQNFLNQMTGKSNLVMFKRGELFSDQWFGRLRWTRKYGAMIPVLRENIRLVSDPQETITVLGINLLQSNFIQRGQIIGPAGQPLSYLNFLMDLTNSHAIFLAQSFVDQHHLIVGHVGSFLVNDQIQKLWIAGSIKSKTMSQQLAVMDIAAAQYSFHRIGKLSQIQWYIRNSKQYSVFKNKLVKYLPKKFLVTRPSTINKESSKLLRDFQTNLFALSLISLLVAAFMIYNSMFLSIVKRVEEIGILRALGVQASQIFKMILVESMMLASLGVLGGFFIAKLLLIFILNIINVAVRNLYEFVNFKTHFWILPHVYWIIGLSWIFTIVSTIPTILMASQIPPAQSIKRYQAEIQFKNKSPKIFLRLGIVSLLISMILSQLPSIHGLPWFGYSSAFFLLMGGAFLTPKLVESIASFFTKKWKWLSLHPKMALKNLNATLSRSCVAIASLGIAVALVLSITILINSFQKTVTVWLNQTLQAELYIKPIGMAGGRFEAVLSNNFIDRLSKLSCLSGLSRFHQIIYPFHKMPISICDYDMLEAERYHLFSFKQGGRSSEIFSKIIQRHQIIISEPLAIRDHLSVGKTIWIHTNLGREKFKIAGIYYDYSNANGTIGMNRKNFIHYFHDTRVNAVGVYLKSRIGINRAEQAIFKLLGPHEKISIRNNEQLKKHAMKIFNQTFSVTYVMEAIALAVAILGVFTTLTVLVLERKMEIVILKYLGMPFLKIFEIILWEGIWIGIFGVLIGFFMGWALSLILVDVINVQAFGWTLKLMVPWESLGKDIFLILGCTLVASIYPAMLIKKNLTIRPMSQE